MVGIAILCFSYVLSQFYRSFLAVLVPVLNKDLGMTASELSYASGAWFITFALAQFPIGYWLDHYGPKRTAAWLLAIGGGGGVILFGLAQSPIHIILAMGMIGIGCAPVLMATFFVLTHNFPIAKFATLGSTFMAIGMLGNVLGSQPLAALVEAVGWRASAFGLGAVTLINAALVYAYLADPVLEENSSSKPGGFLELIANKQLWRIFPIVLFAYAASAGIRGLWAGPILAELYGLDVLEIGYATLFMALAFVAGSLVYGPLDRLFNTRKWVVAGGNAAVLAILAVFIFAMPQSATTATVLMVGICLFGSSYVVQMAHGKAFVPAHLTGRGVTLLNFFSIGGVGLMQYVSGFAMQEYPAGDDLSGHYAFLFAIYGVVLGVAFVVYLFSKDMRPNDL